MDYRGRRQFLIRAAGLGLSIVGLAQITACGLSMPFRQATSRATKVRLIGVIGDENSARWDAFREGLRELSWVEEQNLAIEYRWTGGANSAERYSAFTTELAQLNVEIVVAGALLASIGAKQATSTIPIVTVLATGEALENGIVDNIARPGGNVTGTAGISGAQLEGKQLQVLKAAVADASRIAVVAFAKSPSLELRMQVLQSAATTLGVQLQTYIVQSAGDLENAFLAIGAAGADAVKILATTTWDLLWKQIADLALRYRLPALTEYRQFPQAGGLMAYGVDRVEIYRRAATYVDKILKGAQPGDLPMERPTRFDFIVNMKTAQTVGLTIPQTVLSGATELIN